LPELVDLDYRTCRELLAGGVVGRVAVCTPTGPRILPVNYSVIEEQIVFRTHPYTVLGTYAWNRRLAFEVDQVEYFDHRGWSVVAHGPGELIEDEDRLALIRAFRDPRPWAPGQRLLYVGLRWDELTGRRLGSGWTRDNELPVRRFP
jgi:nitroimidazol reductase NimA-like FMN-containing flavoprotein (pyridoxamine 5'-phosphate oxidase superfamily)